MKKIAAIIAVLALALVLLTACGSKVPNLVGTWQAEWMGTQLKLEFRDNNTYTLQQGGDDAWETLQEGTYNLNGNKLTWNDRTVTVSGQKVNDVEMLSIGTSATVDGQDQAYIITYTRK